MIEDLEKVLFTESEISRRIAEVGDQISRDYAQRELMLVAVLKGAVFFLTHLAQSLTIHARIDFLGIEKLFSRESPAGSGSQSRRPGHSHSGNGCADCGGYCGYRIDSPGPIKCSPGKETE